MSTTTQRPTPETDNAIKAAIQNEDEDHERLAAVARKLERERDEAREQLESILNVIPADAPCLHAETGETVADYILGMQKEVGRVHALYFNDKQQLNAMREAIKEAHADIQSGHELWPVWVGTPTTMQVHQSMQSALAKLQPFLKP